MEEFAYENTNDKFTSKEVDILLKNKNFFSSKRKYIDDFLEIINGQSKLSIRVIDWFVTNYSKKYDTFYKIKINNKESYFYVNMEYKNQLNSYSKMYFDPFCRKKKIIYNYSAIGDPIKFITSIGQLNFFQWALRNKVIHYVNLHLDEIISDMKKTIKLNKEKKESSENSSNKSNNLVTSDSESEDEIIGSSDKVKKMIVSPSSKKVSSIKSSSEKKRQSLTRSSSNGIKKSVMKIQLDFD